MISVTGKNEGTKIGKRVVGIPGFIVNNRCKSTRFRVDLPPKKATFVASY